MNMNVLASWAIDNRTISELLRYGILGFTVNCGSYGVYISIVHFGLTPKFAMSLTYILGLTISFWGNRKFIFTRGGSLMSAGPRFFAAHCVGYLFNLLILVIMVDQLGFAHQWVQAVAILIVAAYLFLASKYFVFKALPPETNG